MSARKRRPTTVTRAIEAESRDDDLEIMLIAREVQARGETAQIVKSLAGWIVEMFETTPGADLMAWLDQLDAAWERQNQTDIDKGIADTERFLGRQ